MSEASLVEAVLTRRSYSKVNDEAPTSEEVRRLAALAATVADHSGLAPWRLIEVRGEARERVGAAIAESAARVAAENRSTLTAHDHAKLAAKTLRAPLLLAVVASRVPSFKVPEWEQDAVTAGVAHLLSLLLDDAGWGVMWRTGTWTRQPEVAAVHGLSDSEELLGWLYVGGIPDGERRRRVASVDVDAKLSALPDARAQSSSAPGAASGSAGGGAARLEVSDASGVDAPTRGRARIIRAPGPTLPAVDLATLRADVAEESVDQLLIDLREDDEVAIEPGLPGALHLPFSEAMRGLRPDASLRDRAIVLYCAHGVRSGIVGPMLIDEGWSVAHIEGGLEQYLRG